MVKLEQVDMQKMELQLQEMQSARNMQLEAMKSNDPLVRRFVYFFIGFWSIWSAVMLPFMVFGDIPESNVRFADTILGFLLATMIGSMFGFLLGSSLGSKEKDKK
jgi:cytochrome c biogenesis protein CcdA